MSAARHVALAIVVAIVLPACGAASRQPTHFTGATYEKICKHPSMNAATMREAFACQSPAAERVVIDRTATRGSF